MSDADTKVDTKAQPEEKKKASRSKKEKAPKEAVVAEPVRASSRSVKKPERFEPENAQHEFKAADIVKGKGTKLVDIPNVEARLSKTKPKEAFLKKIYRIVFPGASIKETHIKKDLREFSGFKDTSEEHTQQVVDKLNKFDMNSLRHIADLLDVERTSKKEELAEHIAAFLNKPADSGRPLRAKTAVSKKTKSSASKGDKEPSARGPSPYILFSTEQRAKVKADNPSLTFGELGKLLGEKWRELSDEEKQKYKDAAAAAPKSNKPAKKRKASTKKEGTKKRTKKNKDSEEAAEDAEDAEDGDDAAEDDAGDDDAEDDAGDDEAGADE